MKIFVTCNKNLLGDNNPAASALSMSDGAEVPAVFTLPDTALTRCGRPFFVPNFAEPCSYSVHLLVRICRLGRSIPERFAYRYYDAMTVGVLFSAGGLWSECRAKGLPWELSVGFDGAACMGELVPTGDGAAEWPAAVRLDEDGEMVVTGAPLEAADGVDRQIARISQFYTLRQGDLLYAGSIGHPLPARIGTQLTGWMDGRQVLSFKIK